MEEVLKYIEHPKVKATYQRYKSLMTDDYPELNYFGVNFQGDKIVSVKFYFAFFRKLTIEEVAFFLPQTADFMRYYHLWEPTKSKSLDHTGCTFEIKFKADDFPVLGFHYRLKPSDSALDIIGAPRFIPSERIDLKRPLGINFEYEKQEVLKKSYYYFQEQQDLDFIAEKFQIPFAKNVDLAEYAESEHFAKVILWKLDLSDKSKPQFFTEKNQELIDYYTKNYNLVRFMDGFYENGEVKSTYFINLNRKEEKPFDAMKIDTLKLFYEHV